MTDFADPATAETQIDPVEGRVSWRDHLPVHPAANLFPPMSKDELRELGEDIKANGLASSIVLYKGKLLDGRNRLDAMELVGERLDRSRIKSLSNQLGESIDPHDFVIAANLHRRHLTGEQKREIIAKVLRAKPAASNRQIANQVKADDKTVASVRRDLESTAEIPQLDKTVGADGKQRKSRAKKPEPVKRRVTESAEVSTEQRRADMARLDEPVEETVDEVNKRVSCVANTIRRHAAGLTHSDVTRFFATLRDMIDVVELAVLADGDEPLHGLYEF